MTCGFYVPDGTEVGRPCEGRAVDTLVWLNPLCGGGGKLGNGVQPVCVRHLREHLAEHLLGR